MRHRTAIIINWRLAGFIGTNINPQNTGSCRRHFLQISCRRIHAKAVKAVTIDHRMMFWQAKNARFWIARLRQRRDGANFDMTKAKLHRAIKASCILVKTSRQPKRIGKFQTRNCYA